MEYFTLYHPQFLAFFFLASIQEAIQCTCPVGVSLKYFYLCQWKIKVEPTFFILWEILWWANSEKNFRVFCSQYACGYFIPPAR